MPFKYEHPENKFQRYYAKHRKDLNYKIGCTVSATKVRRKHRQKIIDMLGGKCCKCGEADIRCLQIDHIDGGGNKERIQFNNCRKYYKMVIKSIENKENKYQLLCANCNFKKRDLNNRLI